MGMGTWAWGERGGSWGFGVTHDEPDLRQAFEAGAALGPMLFDTAEKYGAGESEQFLGRYVRESGRRVVVATKFSPTRWQVRRADLLAALRGSLARLGLPRVDLYQLHWPTVTSSLRMRMDAMAQAVGEGLVRAVGVANVSADQVRRAHDALARHRIPLATVQVEYSLLNRTPETDGVLAACAERGVTLIAYSPLASGLLSGKYSSAAPPDGERRERFAAAARDGLEDLLSRLRAIGEAHGGSTVAQVALAWLRSRGVLPIPGAKNRAQAEDNTGALDLELDPAEIDELSRLSAPGYLARAS